MDKKNTTIGILFLAAALSLMLFGGKLFHQEPPLQPASEQTQPATAGSPADAALAPSTGVEHPIVPAAVATTEAKGGIVPAPGNSLLAGLMDPADDSEFVVLENEFIAVRFTPLGGAIAEVSLKKYPAVRDGTDPYVLNAHRVAPALAFLNFAGADRAARYELASRTAQSVTWRAVVAGQLEVTRTYTLHADAAAGEPYLIRHETSFRSLTGTPVATPELALNMGSAEPVNASDYTSFNVAACRDKDVEFCGAGKFAGSGAIARFFGRNAPEQAVITLNTADPAWASVKNQFFTTILIPEKPSGRVQAQRVALGAAAGGHVGITGTWFTAPLTVTPEQPASLKADFYAGPKEYKRLNSFDREQYRIMEWGSFIGIFAALLFKLMNGIHGFIAGSGWAWGWAIIATTIIIRTLMWPITAQAARSAKRMGKIQGPLKEIQEKYKDNRVKQQEETIKLFREHKINPVGGCLPLLFQFPIFIGLFKMLSSASELRFADFLWIHDLSAADTVAHIPGIGLPINPMPLLMGVSMWIQMRMTPTPTTDNASAKMMKFMPFFVTFMCYSFSSGLAVYWTASNCFSIFQQWITNRRKDPVDTAPAAGATKPGAADRAKPVRDAKVSNVSKKKK